VCIVKKNTIFVKLKFDTFIWKLQQTKQ
jgi:hypothetical protein